MHRGRDLEEAITTALKGTGAAVLATFSVIVGGLAPWMFSPVLFHKQMAVLLIILMFTNLVMGLTILPAYVAWARPRFIFGGVAEELRRRIASPWIECVAPAGASASPLARLIVRLSFYLIYPDDAGSAPCPGESE